MPCLVLAQDKEVFQPELIKSKKDRQAKPNKKGTPLNLATGQPAAAPAGAAPAAKPADAKEVC